MRLGRVVRKLLGRRYARSAGRAYRAIFVDLARTYALIAAEIPTGAHVLDVGGGDGEPLNLLLASRPDICISTIDVAAAVGQWVDPAFAGRITCLPSTTLEGYMKSGRRSPDVLLISDVLHHVPSEEREGFLSTVVRLLRRSPGLKIIVKDVEPGHLRATLGFLSDRYVTGDRSVSPIARAQLVMDMERLCDGIRWSETGLFSIDKPNYAIVFWQ